MGNNVSSTNIENEISNFIMQQQRSLVNVVTQSVINVSHKIIQEQTASIISSASASNILNGYQIIVKNGAKFSVVQQNYLKSNAEAILNLIQDNSLVLNLSNNIKNDVMASLAQNADVSNKLTAAATLLKEQRNSGELNGAISAISDVASKTMNAFKSTEDRNNIINKVIQSYIMKQDAETNLQNLINNTINQNIKQQTISNCVNNSTLSNVINLKKIIVDGPTASFNLTQKNMLDAFYKCVISSTVKSSELQKLSNDLINTSSLTSGQGIKSINDAKITVSSIDSKTATSWLDNLNSMIGIIVIVVVICIIYILYKLFKPAKSDKNTDNNQEPKESHSDRILRRQNQRVGRVFERRGADGELTRRAGITTGQAPFSQGDLRAHVVPKVTENPAFQPPLENSAHDWVEPNTNRAEQKINNSVSNFSQRIPYVNINKAVSRANGAAQPAQLQNTAARASVSGDNVRTAVANYERKINQSANTNPNASPPNKQSRPLEPALQRFENFMNLHRTPSQQLERAKHLAQAGWSRNWEETRSLPT
jgi:hypothetical protein